MTSSVSANARAVHALPRPRLLLVHDSSRQQKQTTPTHAAAPQAAQPGWQALHEQGQRLAKARSQHEFELCRWLAEAKACRLHARLGFASLREYAERLLGLTARQCEERLRVGRALERLPELRAAFEGGELVWSVARELTRVATRQTEQAWLAWARGRLASEVASEVATTRVGERPRGPGEPVPAERVRHRLSFEVSGETLALFRQLEAEVRADLAAEEPAESGDQALEGDRILFEIARRALDQSPQRGAAGGGAGAGPARDPGRASYQIAITRCDRCKEATLEAAGRSHPVSEAFAEMVECDAQYLGNVSAAGGQLQRSAQGIPPRIRRAVIRRDHQRCTVPGCRHHRFVDVHHVDPRSDGGTHDPERLIVLCGAHHRACHEGLLLIDGRASSGFTFHHADGTPYGTPPIAPRQDIAREVLGALTQLGFARKRAEALLRQGQRQLAQLGAAAGQGAADWSKPAQSKPAQSKPAQSEPAQSKPNRTAAREALLRAALAAASLRTANRAR